MRNLDAENEKNLRNEFLNIPFFRSNYILKLSQSKERSNHDAIQLELESVISLKVDELSQANSAASIERYESSLAKLFEQKDIKIDEFKYSCAELERLYQKTLLEQEELLAAELSAICNAEEEIPTQPAHPIISPSPEEDGDVSWGRELELRAAKKSQKAQVGSKKNAKNSSLEKLPTFNNEDFEVYDAIPFSVIMEKGDEIVNDISLHQSIRDAYLKISFMNEMKEEFQLFVARFYEERKSALSSKLEQTQAKREKMLAKEIRMMKKFNESRFTEIKTKLSSTRIDQLNEHEKLLSVHESNIKSETSFLISQSKDVNKSAKKFLETIRDLGTRILEKAKETQYSREMKEVVEMFEKEYDAAQCKLKAIFTEFTDNMDTVLSEVKRANSELLRSYIPFSESGYFSAVEKEEAEKRLVKLEKQLVRAMRNIQKESEKNLPKRMKEFEDLRKTALVDIENFQADVEFVGSLEKEIRRIKIEVSGIIENGKIAFKSLEKNAQILKAMDRAFNSPSHEYPSVSLADLEAQWKTTRKTANQIVSQFKKPFIDENGETAELSEFYEKWLLGPKEKSPSPIPENINRFGRRMSSLRIDNPARKALSQKVSRGQQNTAQTQSSGIVRRIIRDPKSQLKFSIFALDAGPEMTDIPTQITNRMMSSADMAMEIIDEFFKKKGPRETIFCKTPESFDKGKALSYLEDALQKIFTKAQSVIFSDFKSFEIVCARLRKIEEYLPSKIFSTSYSDFEKQLKSGEKELQKRNEFFEEALEDARKDHLNQLRVNLGHPDDLWKLEKIKEDENERVLRESKFIKDKAEEQVELLDEITSDFLSQLCQSSLRLAESFSDRVLFVEIMEENPVSEPLTLRRLAQEHLPDFKNEEIIIQKKTRAHLELEKERQLHFMKIKNIYSARKLEIRNEESNLLEDLHRWEIHFESQIQDIKSLYSSV